LNGEQVFLDALFILRRNGQMDFDRSCLIGMIPDGFMDMFFKSGAGPLRVSMEGEKCFGQ
jgi:hypothetical protein